MPHIFISYSRKDVDFAQKIVDALAANNLDTWIDWKSIPKGEDWEQEIYRGIEEADAFLFLISPDSVASAMCNKEIAHAVKNGKRILPIVIRDAELKIIHAEISKRNWIFCREERDNFTKAIEETLHTIHTDYEWLKYHTDIQVKALIWQSQKDDESLLLRGRELAKSEQKLAIVESTRDPQPTDLQKEYIAVSRQEEVRKRKQLNRTYAFIFLLILAAFTGSFYGVAQFNRIIPLRNENLTKQAQITIEANANATAQAQAATQSSAKATAQALAATQVSANATAQAQAATQVSANATAQTRMQQETVISRSQELASQSIRERKRSFDLSMLLSVEAFRVSDTAASRSALFDATFTNPQLIQYLHRHTDSVYSVAFSPDGKLLATSSSETIDLWSTESHKLIGTLSANGEGKCLAFSPDGKILADGYYGKIILWDIATKKPIGNPLAEGSEGSSECSISFSPDSKLIAMSNWHGSFIGVWNVKSNYLVAKLTDNINSFVGVAFSPDGKVLASASGEFIGGDQSIVLWSVDTLSPIGRLNSDPDFGFSSLAFSPNGKFLAAGGAAGVTLWSLDTLQPIKHLYSETLDIQPHVLSLAYSPDGTVLAAGGDDNNITIWDLSTENSSGNIFSRTFLTGHTSAVLAVAFSPDGKTLASGSEDQNIILWDMSNKYPICKWPNVNFGAGVNTSTLSDDASMFATENWEDHTIRLCDVSTGEIIGQIIRGSTSSINSLAFSPDNKILAVGGCGQSVVQDGVRDCLQNEVIFYDVKTQNPIGQPLKEHTGWVKSVAFSPDGKILASGSSDDTIVLLNMAGDSQSITQLTDTHDIFNLAFSPNGKILASEIGDKITLWDMSTHQSVGQLEGTTNSNLGGIVFSPDGKILASASDDNTIILWNLTTQQFIGQPLKGQTGRILSLAFSPDNKFLASGSEDESIFLWNVTTQEPVGSPLTFHNHSVMSVRFRLDGKTLVSGDTESNVILWDMDSNSWVNKTCERAGRNFSKVEWQQYFPNEEYRITCPQWPAGE